MNSLRSVMTLVVLLALGVTTTAQVPAPPPARIPLEILQAADGTDLYVCVTVTSATHDLVLGKELPKDEFRLFVGPANHMLYVGVQHVFRSRYTAGLYIETSQGVLYVPMLTELIGGDLKGYSIKHIAAERLTDPKWGERPLILLDSNAFVVSETNVSASIEPKGQK